MAGNKWPAIFGIATFIKHPQRGWKSARAHFSRSVMQFGTSTSSRSNRGAGNYTGKVGDVQEI